MFQDQNENQWWPFDCDHTPSTYGDVQYHCDNYNYGEVQHHCNNYNYHTYGTSYQQYIQIHHSHLSGVKEEIRPVEQICCLFGSGRCCDGAQRAQTAPCAQAHTATPVQTGVLPSAVVVVGRAVVHARAQSRDAAPVSRLA